MATFQVFHIMEYQGKRFIMKFFRTAAIVAMLLEFSLGDVQLIQARAEETPLKGVDASQVAPVINAVEPAPVVKLLKEKKKTAAKRKKDHKKTAAKKKTVKKVNETIVEKSTVNIMTINQVQEILNTTRDLSGRNLGGLHLIGINLSKCNLKGADLSHANLERADLGGSDLERADLAGANLKMANLRLCGMIGANLAGAILEGAIWKDGRVCETGSVGRCKELSSPSF